MDDESGGGSHNVELPIAFNAICHIFDDLWTQRIIIVIIVIIITKESRNSRNVGY